MDLTDEELDAARTLHATMEIANKRAYVDPNWLHTATLLKRLGDEVQRHRAMVKRLEEWATEIGSWDCQVMTPWVAAELHNRMKGG